MTAGVQEGPIPGARHWSSRCALCTEHLRLLRRPQTTSKGPHSPPHPLHRLLRTTAYEPSHRCENKMTESHQHDEERARLDALLKNRPNQKELQEKNILKDSSVAPALQAAQASLQKHQIEDKLGDKLEHRPDRAELERLGILKAGNVAPALQAKQEELRRAQVEDSLERRLEGRRDRAELERLGILKGGGVAPGLLAKQEELKRSQLEDKLSKEITDRPTKEDLERKGILQQSGEPSL